MNEETIDPEIKKQLEIFADLVPEKMIQKSMENAGVELKEGFAVGLVPLLLNPKYIGYLIKSFSRFIKANTGQDYTVGAKNIAEFFFKLNDTIKEIKQKHPKKFAFVTAPMLGLDVAGTSTIILGKLLADRDVEEDILEIIANNFELKDFDDITRENPIGKTPRMQPAPRLHPPAPKVPKPSGGKISKPKKIPPPRFNIHEVKRMKELAGINKKVL
jgi:hypothetical protein